LSPRLSRGLRLCLRSNLNPSSRPRRKTAAEAHARIRPRG